MAERANKRKGTVTDTQLATTIREAYGTKDEKALAKATAEAQARGVKATVKMNQTIINLREGYVTEGESYELEKHALDMASELEGR